MTFYAQFQLPYTNCVKSTGYPRGQRARTITESNMHLKEVSFLFSHFSLIPSGVPSLSFLLFFSQSYLSHEQLLGWKANFECKIYISLARSSVRYIHCLIFIAWYPLHDIAWKLLCQCIKKSNHVTPRCPPCHHATMRLPLELCQIALWSLWSKSAIELDSLGRSALRFQVTLKFKANFNLDEWFRGIRFTVKLSRCAWKWFPNDFRCFKFGRKLSTVSKAQRIFKSKGSEVWIPQLDPSLY